MKHKVLKGTIVGAPKGSWYEKYIGMQTSVVAFTHNYYLDAEEKKLMYRIKDIQLIK